MRPIHPGEVLREEFLVPLELSARGLARAIRVQPARITRILGEKRDITGEIALRLARYLGTTPELWLGLQSTYDLRRAETELPKAELARIKPLARTA